MKNANLFGYIGIKKKQLTLILDLPLIMDAVGTAGGDTFRQDMEDDLASVAKAYGRTSMPSRNERSSLCCGPAVSPLHNTEPTIRHPSSPTTQTAPPSPLPWNSFHPTSMTSLDSNQQREDDLNSLAIVTDDAFNATEQIPMTPSPIHRHSPLGDAFRELRANLTPVKTPKTVNRRQSLLHVYQGSPKPSPLKPIQFTHCPAKATHVNDESKCSTCGLTYKEYRMKAIEQSKKHYAYRSRSQARARSERRTCCTSDLKDKITRLDNNEQNDYNKTVEPLKTARNSLQIKPQSLIPSTTPKKPANRLSKRT